MRLLPRSLAGRLLATAALAILAALAFAAVAIGHVLERFVIEGLDARLDAQIAVVARAVRPDGAIDPARAVDVPPFDAPGSGWAWQVTAPGGVLRSASLAGPLVAAPDRGPRFGRHRRDDRPRPFEADGADGRRLHGRTLRIVTAAGPAEIVAVGPRWVVERPLRAAWPPLIASLLLLGGALAVAIVVQLRLGLRPVARISAMLGEVRAGTRRRIEVDEPTELLPLVAELNALIAANDAAVARARGHVANLAHGLKTPLAALRLDLAEPGRDPGGRLTAQVARLEAQVRHHLGRARAAGDGGIATAVTDVASHVADLVAALARIHAERGIVAAVEVPAGLAVRCDAQDLDELLGNLLDNGWRHAVARVAVSAARDGRYVRIAIADDGPGLIDDAPRRLDEAGERHGFGLRIARELIELHGGSLELASGPLGGLAATVRLPGVG